MTGRIINWSLMNSGNGAVAPKGRLLQTEIYYTKIIVILPKNVNPWDYQKFPCQKWNYTEQRHVRTFGDASMDLANGDSGWKRDLFIHTK